MKNGIFFYELRKYHNTYYCNCPAKDKCWHLTIVNEIIHKSENDYEPEDSSLAEEAGLIRLQSSLQFPKYKRRRIK